MSTQLDRWTADFGRDYTDRNSVDPRTRVDAFRRIVPAGVRDVLECAANRGHNMHALKQAGVQVVRGVEPAEYARELARADGLIVLDGTVYDIPYEDAGFDLVLTSGLLIHIPDDRLDDALRELHRVSARYVLAIEYAGDDETVPYRGFDDMLWRRDYGAHWRRVFPELRLVDSGAFADGEGFDGASFWLLEKP